MKAFMQHYRARITMKEPAFAALTVAQFTLANATKGAKNSVESG